MSADSYLVADIGGTNARFAIARGDADAGFALENMRRFKNEHFEHLRDAANAYLETVEGGRPRLGCLAVAGPVDGEKIRLTNSTWKFTPADLADSLGLERIIAVNDFAAQARGALLTSAEERMTLSPGAPIAGAPCAVLGPGTGLGLGLLVPQGEKIIVLPTEGGHAGFAPRTEEEIAVGRFIADEYGYVSWERLLSGRGLVNIHRALCHLDGIAWPGLRPEDITSEALTDPGSISRRVVDLFCAAMGGYAGDVAVLTGARGGVYIGGGIGPKIKDILINSAFQARFLRRGPMTRYVEDIPVQLILSEAPALMGAAAIAQQQEV